MNPAPLSPIRTQSSAHDHAKSSANSWAPGPSGCFIGHQASFSETRKEGISVRIPPPLCQSVHIQVLYHCADYSADWFGLSMCLGGIQQCSQLVYINDFCINEKEKSCLMFVFALFLLLWLRQLIKEST